MRLTCPNCGAQYEVPDEVIPVDGRDVQCSNCGDTWFQAHPDHPVIPEPEPEIPVSDRDLRAAIGGHNLIPDEDAESEFVSETDPPDTGDAPPPHPEPARPALDGSVRDVLREEAEREAELRAAEAGGLESQPELGLDSGDDVTKRAEDVTRRAGEARARMARLRGDPVPDQIPAPGMPDDPDAAESRRGLLPDIEEINSTLKSDNAIVAHTASGPRTEAVAGRRRGGFSRGFAISMLLVAGLLLIYANAPKIARAVPQVDPALNAYVAGVDSARLWLDTRIGRLAGR
jgi:predicted Zn finger-like uncharacterized protein